jgi:MOSC domain-containing protein YiiM
LKELGRVVSLFISRVDRRERVDRLNLDMGGVVGDKFNGKDLNRSILLTSLESYDIARSRDIDIEYGELGENILVDFNPYSLPLGSKIIISDAVFKLSQNCTICKSLSRIDVKLPKLLKNDRGLFIQVVKPAIISKKDKVYLI